MDIYGLIPSMHIDLGHSGLHTKDETVKTTCSSLSILIPRVKLCFNSLEYSRDYLKGVFAKNKRGYRLAAKNKRF